MTTFDVTKLLIAIESSFPTFKIDDAKRKDMLAAWSGLLEPYDARHIEQALIAYIRTSKSQFAPSVSQLIGIADNFRDDHSSFPMVISEIEKAIKSSTIFIDAWYNPVLDVSIKRKKTAKDFFSELSPIAKEILGSEDTLSELACLYSRGKLDETYFQTSIVTRWRKDYFDAAARVKQYQSLSPEGQQLVNPSRLLTGQEQKLITGDSSEHGLPIIPEDEVIKVRSVYSTEYERADIIEGEIYLFPDDLYETIPEEDKKKYREYIRIIAEYHNNLLLRYMYDNHDVKNMKTKSFAELRKIQEEASAEGYIS